jgi:hypothetical protein
MQRFLPAASRCSKRGMLAAMPTIEFRIPVAPTDHFYSNVRMAALSLRRLGSPYSEALIQVHVGDKADLASVLDRNPWSRSFPIKWRIVPHELRSYWGTANDRFAVPSEADIVICTDADTCVVGPLDELFSLLNYPEPSVAGLQAHYPPWKSRGAVNDEQWRCVFSHAGVAMPELNKSYSMDHTGAMGNAPPYFNFGFVAFNRAGFLAASRRLEEHTLRVAPVLPMPLFQCQIGLTLAVVEAGLRVVELQHAFNCANDKNVTPDLLRDPALIRVIHYLRTKEVNRATFLTDKDAYETFLSEPKINPINERLRNHVLGLGDAFYSA